MKNRKGSGGSSLDVFLVEEGIYEDANNDANAKSVLPALSI